MKYTHTADGKLLLTEIEVPNHGIIVNEAMRMAGRAPFDPPDNLELDIAEAKALRSALQAFHDVNAGIMIQKNQGAAANVRVAAYLLGVLDRALPPRT